MASQDRYFRCVDQGTINVILIPADWPIDDEGDALGWGATRLVSNDTAIETLWFPADILTDEISESEARQIHPTLFSHLAAIDAKAETGV